MHFETVEPIVYERLGIIHSTNILNEPAFIAFRFLDLARHFYKKKESNTRNDQYNFEERTYCEAIDIKKITDYIIASGLEDIDSACEELGMTPEQIDIVKLTYAREYYSQGDMLYGDAMLKAFEHSPNKTEHTKSLYRDVMKNRNYYANRRDPDAPILERGLKPRKNVQPK